MYWLDNDSGVTTPPAIPAVVSSTRQYFTEGGGGDQPSIPGGEWFNMITDELLQVLTLGGITPDKADHTQLAKALQAIAFNAYPVGAPIPWPTAVPPTGFLASTGQSFSATTYPKLAQAYPSLVLPDLRAELLRGWDNGRGVDTGRSLLSAQGDAVRNVVGTIAFADDDSSSYTKALSSGVFASTGATGPSMSATVGIPATVQNTLRFDMSTVVPTASEARPRNVAFNYIVRAA